MSRITALKSSLKMLASKTLTPKAIKPSPKEISSIHPVTFRPQELVMRPSPFRRFFE